jgi:hypothetical protein
MEILALQHDLRPELPNIYGAHDYRKFRDILIKIDEILTKSGLEHDLISQALEQKLRDQEIDSSEFLNSKRAELHYKKFKHALRCNIARHLTGESYRLFSLRLADSTLFQWFTDISAFGCRKAVSKSTLDRYEKQFDETMIADQIRKWLSGFSDEDKALESGLMTAINFKETYTDSTCVKSFIHFPVDWVYSGPHCQDSYLSILR